MTHPRSVVIVGAGLAGWRTARELRTLEFDGSITLIGAEDGVPYDRPPLSKQVLSGESSPAASHLTDTDEIGGLDVELRAGTAAVDVRSGSVTSDDGQETAADVIVVATGASARRPSGSLDQPRVRVLRTLRDAANLKQAIDGATTLLVLGGGFIGAEVAATAHGLGLEVTIVEAQDELLLGPLGRTVGARVAQMHRDRGVGVFCGSPVDGAVPSDRSVVVRLANGSTLEADVAVAGFGAVPNTAPVEKAGLGDLARGIRCDEMGRTDVPGIYAVGDVACWNDPVAGRHVRREHWSSAGDQAAIVAHTIMEREVPAFLRMPPYFWSDQYGTKIQILGRRELATEGSWLTVDGAGPEDVYGFTRGDELVAVATIGAPRLLGRLRARVAAGNDAVTALLNPNSMG